VRRSVERAVRTPVGRRPRWRFVTEERHPAALHRRLAGTAEARQGTGPGVEHFQDGFLDVAGAAGARDLEGAEEDAPIGDRKAPTVDLQRRIDRARRHARGALGAGDGEDPEDVVGGVAVAVLVAGAFAALALDERGDVAFEGERR